ncbi:MAG: hypothetical protein PHW82_17615 [Bacteroidales bacterium]|nr:hypothetical protein [Bacteroidales bacterium]
MRRKIQVVISSIIIINGLLTLAYIFILKNMQVTLILGIVTGILGCLLHWFEEISTIYTENRKERLTGAIRQYLHLSKKKLIIWLNNKTVRAFLITYAIILTILAITLIFKILFGISMFCVFLFYVISLRVIWVYEKKEMGLMNCVSASVMLTCLLIQVEFLILVCNI